jgi:hypothetical protein
MRSLGRTRRSLCVSVLSLGRESLALHSADFRDDGREICVCGMLVHLSLFAIVLDFAHGAQDFAHRPGLCDATMRREWGLALEDLT